MLDEYAERCHIRGSAKATGIDRKTHYNWLKADPAYAAAFKALHPIATDVLEDEAVRRANSGVYRLKFHQGELIRIPLTDETGAVVMQPARDSEGDIVRGPKGKPIMEPVMVPYQEHEYSDTLLIFLLKGNRPEKYSERIRQEHSGDMTIKRIVLTRSDPIPGMPLLPPGSLSE